MTVGQFLAPSIVSKGADSHVKFGNVQRNPPYQLREQIYHHLLSDPPIDVTLHYTDKTPPLTYSPRGILLSLAYNNHSIFYEICLAYLR
jgi:hypothetical protein